jgi:Protein of unknown function, DUF547
MRKATAAAWVFLFAICARGAELDHSRWNTLLTRFVTAASRVDYSALKQRGRPELDSYLQQVAARWPNGMDQKAIKAALINAYNALTIRWIISNYPTVSIWSTDHPFQAVRHVVNGRQVSLDQIEQELRSLHDPRIHAALVCAARSCPPLRREAYVGNRIDEQLDANARDWLANPSLNAFSHARNLASVSEIFKWYEGDFHGMEGVRSFLAEFAPADDQMFLRNPKTVIQYMPYHWGLNDNSGLGADYSALRFRWDWVRNGYLYQQIRSWLFEVLTAAGGISYWLYGLIAVIIGLGIWNFRKIRSELRMRR